MIYTAVHCCSEGLNLITTPVILNLNFVCVCVSDQTYSQKDMDTYSYKYHRSIAVLFTLVSGVCSGGAFYACADLFH